MNLMAALDYRFEQERFEIELNIDLTHWSGSRPEYFCFSMAHPLQAELIEGAVLVERQGDWHRLQLTANGADKLAIKLVGKASLIKATDLPQGCYIEADGDFIEVVLPDLVVRKQLAKQALEFKQALFLPQTEHQQGTQWCKWPQLFSFQSNWNTRWLARLLQRVPNAPVLTIGDGGWPVTMTENTQLESAFTLDICPAGIHLFYRDQQGQQAGQAYVMQYLLQLAMAEQLQSVRLSGSPKYAYRGVHLDVVRHFFNLDDLQGWLDLFALLQFNHFHWHLTDDDGWRLESQAFPELTQVGAWRGAQQDLPPQMGTGWRDYGGFYRADEARELVARATELGMQVVPEMDLPGHARALLKSLPQLQEPEDSSSYSSVQHHNDNVINPALPATDPVLKQLIDEWCEVFPGDLFHIGADEVPKGVWQGSPAVAAWQQQQGLALSRLQPNWLAGIESYLASKGKTLAGWEEVRDGEGVSKNCWVYSWQGVEAGLQAAKAGHPVVMTPAQHCYLDLAVDKDFAEPGYWWAGTLDLQKVYAYQPEHGFGFAVEQIAGVQYCLWSELVENKEQAEYMWFPRLFAGAQVAWGGNTNETYESFLAAVKHWSALFSTLGVAVRALD